MAKVKIEYDVEKCIGAAACAAACPEYWEMLDTGKAHLKGSTRDGDIETLEIDEEGCNREAAEACPVAAIIITEIDD